MDKLKELQDIIDQESIDLSFLFGGAGAPNRVQTFQTSGAQMGSIVSPWVGILRLSNWSLIPCLSCYPEDFFDFYKKYLPIQMPAQCSHHYLAWLEKLCFHGSCDVKYFTVLNEMAGV